MSRVLTVLFCLSALPALAQSAEDCAVFGEIADQAAQARMADGEMVETMVQITERYTGDQERFAGAVPLLVDWVWKLPEDELSGGVGAAYRSACENR